MLAQMARQKLHAVWMLCCILAVSEGRLGGQCPKVAPDFNLAAARGGNFRLRDHMGRAVLLAFLRTQSDADPTSTSRALVPSLISMDRQYRDSGLEVAMVDETALARRENAPNDAGVPDIRALLNTSYDWGLTFPLLADPDSKVARMYGVNELPVIVLIGKKGKVWRCWKGQVHPADLTTGVQELVGDPIAKHPPMDTP